MVNPRTNSTAAASRGKIESLRRRVAQAPDDLNGAIQLGSALYQAGDIRGSADVLRLALRYHPESHQAALLLARTEARQGQLRPALDTVLKALSAQPEQTKLLEFAAALCTQLRDWAELQQLAETWTEHAPDSIAALTALAQSYFEQSKFANALDSFARLSELEPENEVHLIGAAKVAIAALDFPRAKIYLHAAGEINAGSAELLFAYCRLHHLTGELELALEYCEQALDLRPDMVAALIELGILREGKLSPEEIEKVSALFRSDRVHPENRVMLGLVLGDALDHSGQAQRAMAAWQLANDINYRLSAQENYLYSRQATEVEMKMLAELYSDSEMFPSATAGRAQPTPIFVVGMPRSGTTLVESILASHSAVYGAGELPTLYDLNEELLYLAADRSVSAAREKLRTEVQKWRKKYLESLPDSNDAQWVVDKQPLNFRAVGLIRLLFPESPIVLLRREPLDVCLSIFRQKFTKSWPCAHRLPDIAHYYGQHYQLMRRWLSLYPGQLYELIYEDLVDDLQGEVKRLLMHIGLEMEPNCLLPHKNRRQIATFSAVQVQKPVSKSYISRAKVYRKWLTEAERELLTAGVLQQSR